jgi:hypothetical protein
MEKLKITMSDGSQYSRWFESSTLRDQFIYKLELFEGLFIDFMDEDRIIKVNPKFIIKLETA